MGQYVNCRITCRDGAYDVLVCGSSGFPLFAAKMVHMMSLCVARQVSLYLLP